MIRRITFVGLAILSSSHLQTYLLWFRVADANASPVITVRQLLNVTSGIFAIVWELLRTSLFMRIQPDSKLL